MTRFHGHPISVHIPNGLRLIAVTSWFLFVWLLVNPTVIDSPQPSRVAFLMINLIMLGAAGTGGWYGGKLAFRD